MRSNIIAASIVALALVVAALLNGGIYQTQKTNFNDAVWRTNKLTGTVSVCIISTGCLRLAEGPTPDPLAGAILITPTPKAPDWSEFKIVGGTPVATATPITGANGFVPDATPTR